MECVEDLLTNFNPRARAGRDPAQSLLLIVASYFNPRARAGRDAQFLAFVFSLPHFNPRARAGRDSLATFKNSLISVFQSTRPRGARQNKRSV